MCGRARARSPARRVRVAHSLVGLRTALIFTRLVNFCWSLFTWCLLLAVVAALAVGGYLYFRLDDEIRRQVQVRFANHYANFDVQVGSARFDPERGIAIDNFSLTPKTADGTASQPVLAIDEMYLAGNLRIEQLLTNQMQIDNIVVRHASLRLVRQADGEWNASALVPLPHFSDQSPKITIEDASATVEYSAAPGAKPMSLQGVNLTLAPVKSSTDPENKAKRIHVKAPPTGCRREKFASTDNWARPVANWT